MLARSIVRNSGRAFRHPRNVIVLANHARTFSASPFMMGKLTEVITHDHRELEEYYNKIMSSEDKDTMTRYQNEFTWELARHAIAEEIVVYPAMEKFMGEKGIAMAKKDREEHLEIKNLLYKFQGLKAGEPDFKKTLEELWKPLKQHIEEEEHDDLPALEKVLEPNNTSVSYANTFQRTKHFVPTRSHPSAPDKPPFETVTGFLAAPIDKVMDLFRKFPKNP